MSTVYKQLRKEADEIVSFSIREVRPDKAVQKAVREFRFPKGKLILVAAGKAAWQMASAAAGLVHPDKGIVITKYEHVKGDIEGIACYEAGHPVPDKNGVDATKKAIELVSGLTEDDAVLFLLSGGASALFEYPLIPLDELQDISRQLLSSGADIIEMNTIRKRLSGIKGGRFAEICAPAKVFSVVLSDILGDPLDMIGSGPAYPDSSTCEDALSIVEKYHLDLKEETKELLKKETPKSLNNVETLITGSVRELCKAAGKKAEELGYEVMMLNDHMDGIAREEGKMLAEKAAETLKTAKRPVALIEGGETVVRITGKGLGGRNQEIALSSVETISSLPIAVFSAGSDGTDGPTDAAGGYVDGSSLEKLKEKGIDYRAVLDDNDSYHALKEIGGLIFTGPTGTNVNDVAVALILP